MGAVAQKAKIGGKSPKIEIKGKKLSRQKKRPRKGPCWSTVTGKNTAKRGKNAPKSWKNTSKVEKIQQKGEKHTKKF